MVLILLACIYIYTQIITAIAYVLEDLTILCRTQPSIDLYISWYAVETMTHNMVLTLQVLHDICQTNLVKMQ